MEVSSLGGASQWQVLRITRGKKKVRGGRHRSHGTPGEVKEDFKEDVKEVEEGEEAEGEEEGSGGWIFRTLARGSGKEANGNGRAATGLGCLCRQFLILHLLDLPGAEVPTSRRGTEHGPHPIRAPT